MCPDFSIGPYLRHNRSLLWSFFNRTIPYHIAAHWSKLSPDGEYDQKQFTEICDLLHDLDGVRHLLLYPGARTKVLHKRPDAVVALSGFVAHRSLPVGFADSGHLVDRPAISHRTAIPVAAHRAPSIVGHDSHYRAAGL